MHGENPSFNICHKSISKCGEKIGEGWIGLTRLLASVGIFVESSEMENVVSALSKLDSLEELYEVTGEFDIVSMVSASDIEEFHDILKNKIMTIKGVKSTISTIVLAPLKGPKCTEKKVEISTFKQ